MFDLYRIYRGGVWFFIADRARAAYRNYTTPDVPFDALGFRCAKGKR